MTRPDPEQLIIEIKAQAAKHGFKPSRVDRMEIDPKTWIEVGYGCNEITVRHSDLEQFGGYYRFPIPLLAHGASRRRMNDQLEALFATLAGKETP
jgi:hypothetical protein